jgi:uncharacterized membrane protein
MSKILLSVHVLAAILFIGPVTVAASMFPPRARRALSDDNRAGEVSALSTLHRITRVYAVAGLSVPVFGIATASSMGVLGDTWLIVSMILTGIAAVLLAVRIVPDQSSVMRSLVGAGDREQSLVRARTLSITTGLFALLWAIVVVLMITRPGSSTGA